MIGKSPLEKKAASTISRYGMLSGGETVVVSVSGGPDSVALLLLLSGLSVKMDLSLFVFHLDHMFRGEESAADARFVEELANSMGIPCRVVAVDVPALVRSQDKSPQDVARSVRLDELMAYADEVSADRVAVGHTADDQVETFLMRVVQGAGLTGLGGIPPVSAPIIRPLIEVWRREVEDYCRKAKIVPRTDSSNMEQVYLRNRIRGKLVPFLKAEFGQNIGEVILREVESLSRDREYFRVEADKAFRIVASCGDDEVRVDAGALEKLPDSLERGVVRRAWTELLPAASSLAWSHVNDIIDKLVRGKTGSRLDLPFSAVVEREYTDVVFRIAEPKRKRPVSIELESPGKVEIPGTGMVLEASEVDIGEVEFSDDPMLEFASTRASFPLEIRSPLPGDSFWPLGSPGTRKVSDFFIDIKLPRRRRSHASLVLSGGRVVWVAGHRLDERFRLESGESKALRLHMYPAVEYHGRRD